MEIILFKIIEIFKSILENCLNHPIYCLFLFFITFCMVRYLFNMYKITTNIIERENEKEDIFRGDSVIDFSNKEYLGFENHKKEIFELEKIVQMKYENNEMEDFIYDEDLRIYYYNTDLDVYVPFFAYITEQNEKGVDCNYISMVIITNDRVKRLLNSDELVFVNTTYDYIYKHILQISQKNKNNNTSNDMEKNFDKFYYLLRDKYLEYGVYMSLRRVYDNETLSLEGSLRIFEFYEKCFFTRLRCLRDRKIIKMKQNGKFIIHIIFISIFYHLRSIFNLIRFGIMSNALIFKRNIDKNKQK